VDGLTQRGGDSPAAAYVRTALGIAAAVILTFFAMQTFYAQNVKLPFKIGIIVAIAVIGVAGIVALLTPEPDEPQPAERLYTAAEVAALLAAVQSGQLVAAAPDECRICHGPEPDATGVDGSRYHVHCFRNAYNSGNT
jgi:hypothetical protein